MTKKQLKKLVRKIVKGEAMLGRRGDKIWSFARL
jgi:hypothetical protein